MAKELISFIQRELQSWAFLWDIYNCSLIISRWFKSTSCSVYTLWQDMQSLAYIRNVTFVFCGKRPIFAKTCTTVLIIVILFLFLNFFFLQGVSLWMIFAIILISSLFNIHIFLVYFFITIRYDNILYRNNRFLNPFFIATAFWATLVRIQHISSFSAPRAISNT